MQLTNKFTIVCLSVLVIGITGAKNSSKSTVNEKCGSKIRFKIDRSLAAVIPMLNSVKVPENEQQFRKYCSSVSHNMDNVLGYVKSCLGNFGPTIAKLMITSFNNEFNSVCKTEQLTDKARDLMKAGLCANKANTQLRKCGENMIDALMAIRFASDNDKILMSCCHANTLRKCIRKTITETEGCDRKTIDLTKKIGFDSIGKSISNFCGEYFDDSEKCTELIAKTPKLDKRTYTRPKSIFIPFISLLESFQNIKCDKNSENKMDQLFANMITVGSDNPMPENEMQLREYCSRVTQNMGFVFGYVDNCVSDFGQLLAKIMISPLQKQFGGICRPGKLSNKARQMIEGGICGNKARDKLKVCIDKHIDAMVGTALAPVRDRVYMTCCHANALRQCFRDATESTNGCSKRTIDWAEKFVMDSTGGAIGLMCGEYFETNEKCDKLIDQTPKMNPNTYVRPKSVFLPAIALMESFPDLSKN